MSSGGQNGTDISGITSMRIQNASDFTNSLMKQRVYQSGSTDPNRFYWHNFNTYGIIFNYKLGKVECRDCSGVLPYSIPGEMDISGNPR